MKYDLFEKIHYRYYCYLFSLARNPIRRNPITKWLQPSFLQNRVCNLRECSTWVSRTWLSVALKYGSNVQWHVALDCRRFYGTNLVHTGSSDTKKGGYYPVYQGKWNSFNIIQFFRDLTLVDIIWVKNLKDKQNP